MTAPDGCPESYHELGCHRPGYAPNLQARLDLIRSQTAAPRSKGQRSGESAVAPTSAAGSPIFTSRSAAVWSLLAAFVVFAAAAGLAWEVVAR